MNESRTGLYLIKINWCERHASFVVMRADDSWNVVIFLLLPWFHPWNLGVIVITLSLAACPQCIISECEPSGGLEDWINPKSFGFSFEKKFLFFFHKYFNNCLQAGCVWHVCLPEVCKVAVASFPRENLVNVDGILCTWAYSIISRCTLISANTWHHPHKLQLSAWGLDHSVGQLELPRFNFYKFIKIDKRSTRKKINVQRYCWSLINMFVKINSC